MEANRKGRQMQTYPATVAQFKRQAIAGFKRANPDAANLTVEWMTGQFDKPRRIKYPTGLEGFTGTAIAIADGYGTVKITASADRETGIHVRSVQINFAELAPKYLEKLARG
jgi:hypothetical protein